MGDVRRNVRRARSSVVLSTVLLTLFALMVPFAGSAIANHGTRTLDLEPETGENQVGTPHQLTATLSADADATSGNIQVDFEVTGPGDPDATAGDSPTTPDYECVVTMGTDNCTVDIESAAAGIDTVRAWIDHDGSNASFEGDPTEGVDETTEPGDNTNEPDLTDVVEKEWFEGLPAGAVLDCADEDGGDDILNPLDTPNDAETYTCTLVDSTGDPLVGIAIDAENLNGANDADNSAAPGTADMNDACTTDAAGACDVTVDAAQSEAGAALICFWADGDADDDFDQGGGNADDGGQCAEAVTPDNANQTDKVRKEWEARAFSGLTIEPEIDVNENGTQHSVTVTAVDQFGDPIQRANIDITVTGINTDGVDDVSTNAQGVYTFAYTDAVGDGTDTITACIDDNDDDACDAPGTTVTADKIWIDEAATADDVEVDMDGCDGDQGDLTDTATWDDAATNDVQDVHTICASAVTAGGQVLYGHSITFTSTGPGEFLDANGDSLGTTVDVPIDPSGYAMVDITSSASGDQTVSVSIDGQTDDGVKTWAAGEARNIDLTPDTASNNPGTIHTLSALVTDALGNPVPGIEVDFVETGTGVFRDGSSTFTATTGDDGIAVAETTTLETETGEQQITATIDDATTDCDLAADDPNAGDPEGNCSDTAVKRWGPTCPGFEGDTRNQIVGTNGRDTIRGTNGDDVICGLGGKDVLRGAQGNDVIKGGRGDDTMKGGAGDDSLRGNRGPDKAFGNAGTDVCRSAKVQKGCEG